MGILYFTSNKESTYSSKNYTMFTALRNSFNGLVKFFQTKLTYKSKEPIKFTNLHDSITLQRVNPKHSESESEQIETPTFDNISMISSTYDFDESTDETYHETSYEWSEQLNRQISCTRHDSILLKQIKSYDLDSHDPFWAKKHQAPVKDSDIYFEFEGITEDVRSNTFTEDIVDLRKEKTDEWASEKASEPEPELTPELMVSHIIRLECDLAEGNTKKLASKFGQVVKNVPKKFLGPKSEKFDFRQAICH